MQITMMNIAEIRPYERNPRHNDEAVAAVANSIREFGFRNPVILDRDHVIVAGHTRWRAAKSLGLEEIPCVIAEDLTPEQAKAYRLADNRTGEIAGWDYDLLPLELKELQSDGFDLSLLGFDTSELERLLSDVKDEDKEGETEPDEIPDAPEIPDSRPGEVYVLGAHRLMCGDSTSMDDTLKLMGGGKARLYNWAAGSARG